MSRKTLCTFAPLLLAGFVGTAFADDSYVTLYGTLDLALTHCDHCLNFDPNHVVGQNLNVTHGYQPATGFINGGMSATKWGLKGQDDLGGGWKAVFLLEQGFNLPSGNISNAAKGLASNRSTGPNMSADSAISGQFFNRGAYTGLSSNTWGTLTFGRQQSFFLDNIAIFDPILGSQAFSPMGFSGSFGGGGYTDNSRVDNSLKYRVAVGDFDLGALYKLGGVAGSTAAQSAWELNAVYAAGPFAVQLGVEKFYDAFSVGNSTGDGFVTAKAADTKAYMASAKYTWDLTTFRIGYEREEYNDPSNPAVDQQTTSIFGFPIAGLVNVTSYPNEEALNVYWAGIQQQFTPAFSVLSGAWKVFQNQYNCTTGAQSGCSGNLNYYALVGDYYLSKRTDLYLGIADALVTGGPRNAVLNAAPTPSANTNLQYALGMRIRF
ncbi:MAG TPA: porin [Burkholderiaceae bacterium]|nr:porin [Burkholderiaceae bacterium]